MADLYPTKTRLALLRDVEAGRVADERGVPMLDIGGGETAKVESAVYDLERAGWIWQPADSLVWQLSDAGRAVLDDGQADIDPGEGLLT